MSFSEATDSPVKFVWFTLPTSISSLPTETLRQCSKRWVNVLHGSMPEILMSHKFQWAQRLLNAMHLPLHKKWLFCENVFFFRKCDQICNFLRVWSKTSLFVQYLTYCATWQCLHVFWYFKFWTITRTVLSIISTCCVYEFRNSSTPVVNEICNPSKTQTSQYFRLNSNLKATEKI